MEIEQKTPAQVADFLGVGTTALKKYALLLEQHGHTIGRNDKNHRYYTGTDIGIIKAMLILNRNKGVQLEQAADIVTSVDTDISLILKNDDTKNVTYDAVPTVTATQKPNIASLIAPIMAQQKAQYNALREELAERDKLMIQLQSEVATQLQEQAATIAGLRGELEALRKQAEESEEKSGFWNRLFKK